MSAGVRLTDTERSERALTERDLQQLVTDVAQILGYSWCHWRALRTGGGLWKVPVEGPLGAGWPDIFAVRPRDGRAVAIELKRELAHPTADQVAVLAVLEACGIRTMVARPSDLRAPLETSRLWRFLR